MKCPLCNAKFVKIEERGVHGLPGLQLVAHLITGHAMTDRNAWLVAMDVFCLEGVANTHTHTHTQQNKRRRLATRRSCRPDRRRHGLELEA